MGGRQAARSVLQATRVTHRQDKTNGDEYHEWILKKKEAVTAKKVKQAEGYKNSRRQEAVAGKKFTKRETKQQPEKAKCNVHTLLTELKSCSLRRDLQWGLKIHAKAVESHHESNVFVVTALIRMYAKCGSMVDARRMFDSVQKPDVVCWNVLLLGYVQNGEGRTALELFSRMKGCGCAPDTVTCIAAVKACASLTKKQGAGGQEECLKLAKEIHSEIGCNLDSFLQNTLIDMYAKCGSMVDARQVFDNIQKPDVVSWNILLLGYAENGNGRTALDLFSEMKNLHGCAPDSATYIAVLKACTCFGKPDANVQGEVLKWVKEIHSEIGCKLDMFLQNTLIDVYAKCCSMVDARQVFDSIQKPDVVSWTSLILGYVENREGLNALDLFSRMKSVRGCAPNSVTYIAALKACMSLAEKQDTAGQDECLRQGSEIHSQIGSDLDINVLNTLIDMYAKCGRIVVARRVFDSIRKPDVVSWNVLLLGCAETGEGLTALKLFSRMKECGCVPDSVTYVAALKACSSLVVNGDGDAMGDCLKWVKEIHSEIGCPLDHQLQNLLISMYAKCDSMADARHVFDSIRNPNVVSWSALILGYAENGESLTALELFSRMKAPGGCTPNSVTYIAALKACGLIGALALGREFHSDISEFTTSVVTCLVDFYAKCGSMMEACEVFDLHSTARIVPTWNALLAGYGSFGDTCSVFNLFEAMQDQGFQPDAVTFVCMLSCCSHAGLVEKAREYFEAIPLYGVTRTVKHYNCLIDILGRANQLNEAVAVLRKMPCNPNAVTWMTFLGACRKWKNAELGRWAFHSLVDIDKKDASAYVHMAHIYGDTGVWEEHERVLEMRKKFGACDLAGEAFVMDEFGNTVKFVVGEEDPPEVKGRLEQRHESE